MWFHLANVLFEVRHFFTFHILERTHTLEHFVEIYLMAVEFRTVHTNELGLTTYSNTASTTHTGTVYHDGVKWYVSRDFVFLGQQATEFHHNGRTDSETLVYLLTLDDTFDSFGYKTFGSIRTVVGHDDDLIRWSTYLVFEDNQFLATSGKYGDDTVTRSLQCLDDRKHRSDTYTTTGTYYGTEILNMSSLSKRTYHVEYIIAFIELAKLGGWQTDSLYYQGNGSFFYIRTCNGQWHSLSLFVHTYNHEVAGTAWLRNQWRFNL